MKSELILALDFNQIDEVKTLLNKLEGEEFWVKIGMESFYTFGPELFNIIPKKHKIFLDLKLHDIPETVEKSLRTLLKFPISMVNVHALGGKPMLERVGKLKKDFPNIKMIAVTHLTSLNQEDITQLGFSLPLEISARHLGKLSFQAGLDGVVCSGFEIEGIKKDTHHNFLTIVPGIRLKSLGDDQKRVMTPSEASKLGANFIVVGRPITQASDPLSAMKEIKGQL